MNALSVGLPGRLKSSRTLFMYAQWSSAFEVNRDPPGRLQLGYEPDDARPTSAARTHLDVDAEHQAQQLRPPPPSRPQRGPTRFRLHHFWHVRVEA
jgi:hypothetical protein